MPRVGLATHGPDAAAHFAHYAAAIRRAGGEPVLLGPEAPETWLGGLDALVVPGGSDIDPARYGGRAHPTVYGVDPARDERDLELARRAVERRLPALFICRGQQVLNVALGGTLIEDLPDEVGRAVPHVGSDDYVRHEVSIEPGSRLAARVGAAVLEVASWHHQAVRRVAPGLRAVARAADGTIEALESAENPELLAVQWHPEHTAAREPAQQALFDALVRAAARR